MTEVITQENTASEEQSVETGKSAEQLQVLNDKLYSEVKSLRTESKDRRLKLEEFEKREQEAKDADLSWKEKHEKLSVDFNDYKTETARTNLNRQFAQHAIEAGLPSKIAKVAVPSDLSDDNMKDKVKAAVKEFSDFVKIDEKEEKPATNPLASVQPAQHGPTDRKFEYPGQYTSKEAAEKLLTEITD